MKIARARRFLLGAFLLFSLPAHACEPIYPFMEAIGGPGLITKSWFVLGCAVALKAILFAGSQQRISFVRASGLMVLGNLFTTGIGVLAAAMLASGPILFVGVIMVWGFCVVPARRLIIAANHPWLRRLHPVGLGAIMALVLASSCILFGIAAGFQFSGQRTAYWILKLSAIYPALIMSMALTAFWEEWVVWKFSGLAADDLSYVQPVIRANLIVLLAVMAFAAAIAFPKRLKSPDFFARNHAVPEVTSTQRSDW